MLAGKNDMLGEGRRKEKRILYSRSRRPRKKSVVCIRARSPLRSSPRPWCRVFSPTRREISIRDYIINIHVTRRVLRQCSNRIPTYLSIRRSSMYLCIETTRGRVYSCTVGIAHRASVPYLPPYNTDILQKATEAKRGTTFLLSLRLPPRVLSLFLSPSLARARGIKYNKDIQWELIGDISTYLPFTRGALLPPVHNAGMRRRCRDARFASLSPLYVPFLSCSPVSRFFLSPSTE